METKEELTDDRYDDDLLDHLNKDEEFTIKKPNLDMETKQKTWEECCSIVASKLWPNGNWEEAKGIEYMVDNHFLMKDFKEAADLYAFDKIKRAIELARQESKEDVCENCGADSGLHQYETGLCPLGGREETRFDKLSGKWFLQKWESTTFKMKVGNKYTEQEILDQLFNP